MSRALPAGWAIVLLAALAGCGSPEPTGQVVAKVGGEDITRRDLAAEAASGGSPARTEADMRGRVLAGVVDRRLLVALASREGLERTPEYLAATRRQREVTLADMAMRQIADRVPEPTPEEARTFARDHRWMFADRLRFLLRPAGDPASAGIWVDGDRLSAEQAKRLAAARDGQAVAAEIGVEDGTVVVLSRRPAPVTGRAADEAARALLWHQRIAARVSAVIEAERAKAEVRYQRGFGPAAR